MSFQIVWNIPILRQNHKGKKWVEITLFGWKAYFLEGVLSGVFLYMVRNIISPVIKFYRELSTFSTVFSTPRKAAWIKGLWVFLKNFHTPRKPY